MCGPVGGFVAVFFLEHLRNTLATCGRNPGSSAISQREEEDDSCLAAASTRHLAFD